MKRRVLSSAFPLLLVAACAGGNPVAPQQPLPTWLTTLIRGLTAAPPANPPAFIARYEYRGETVYFVPQRCCDVWSSLYHADGTILCHPDGGLTGLGDGKCPDFAAERKHEVIVWRDPRAGVALRHELDGTGDDLAQVAVSVPVSRHTCSAMRGDPSRHGRVRSGPT